MTDQTEVNRWKAYVDIRDAEIKRLLGDLDFREKEIVALVAKNAALTRHVEDAEQGLGAAIDEVERLTGDLSLREKEIVVLIERQSKLLTDPPALRAYIETQMKEEFDVPKFLRSGDD